jgi:hypothetical protein
MKKKNISVSWDEIRNTPTFKGLSSVNQKIILNRTIVKHIEHGVNVSVNTGFENWQKQTAFNNTNQNIVKELSILKDHKNEKQTTTTV